MARAHPGICATATCSRRLKTLLAFYGPNSKAIVWAHNSHIGNAAATEMFSRGEYNIGHLCRKEFGDRAYAIGFGTNTGTVAAASNWDGPMEIKIDPAGDPGKLRARLSCRPGKAVLPVESSPVIARASAKALRKPRLERAIGVIYRPETELASHYFQAVLPEQFDEYVWFDETSAITPFETKTLEDLPDTYPFGL